MLHTNGPALWPDHKPLSEVLELEATTIPSVWEATYQGNPTAPEGTIFMRAWWSGQNRYAPLDSHLTNWVVARWLSWDTGLKDEEDNAYSACTVGELWPDYRLAIREVYRERLTFPDLPEQIERLAYQYNRDEKLRGVLIEDKASGTSAYQTLRKKADPWLSNLLVAFMPTEDKVTRGNQAAVWCKQGCILLPEQTDSGLWLYDFEDELFNFPGSVYKDQVDSFTQLILYTENLLEDGWKTRSGR